MINVFFDTCGDCRDLGVDFALEQLDSADEVSVVMCGVQRYSRRNVLSTCFQDMPSASAKRVVFPSGRMKRSAISFDWGQRGVIFR